MTNEMTYYAYNGKTYEETYHTDNDRIVYERLASAMVRKHLFKSPYIMRATDTPDYATGQRVITIYYNMEGMRSKEVYKVAV